MAPSTTVVAAAGSDTATAAPPAPYPTIAAPITLGLRPPSCVGHDVPVCQPMTNCLYMMAVLALMALFAASNANDLFSYLMKTADQDEPSSSFARIGRPPAKERPSLRSPSGAVNVFLVFTSS